MGPDTFTFIPSGVEGSEEFWVRCLMQGWELGLATAKLYNAEQGLRTANAAFMAGEDRASVRRVVAQAVYDVAYDEYKAAFDHAKSAQP